MKKEIRIKEKSGVTATGWVGPQDGVSASRKKGDRKGKMGDN